jgi:hypothetical protein
MNRVPLLESRRLVVTRSFASNPEKRRLHDSQAEVGRISPLSRKKDKAGKRRNLGTFSSREKAKAHERAVQYFKRH